MNHFHSKHLLSTIFILGIFLVPSFVRAAQITVDTSFLNANSSSTSIQDFISDFYNFGLGIAGIIAVGMIVAGGMYYTISGASPQKKGEAKDMIFSAIWGLVLLFGSYLILKSVNPQLVELRDPGTGMGSLENTNDLTCSSSTLAVDENGNKTSKTIPECREGQSPIDPDTGYCQCYKKDKEKIVCPGVLKPIKFDPVPNYSWDKHIGYATEVSRPVDINSSYVKAYPTSTCPKVVHISEGAVFRTIDCDTCEADPESSDPKKQEGWGKAGTDDWGPYEKKVGDSEKPVDTIGWVWPYYPKNIDTEKLLSKNQKDQNEAAKRAGKSVLPYNPGSFAICIMYAHYNPEEKTIERSDLDGLKPCTEFDDDVKLFHGFTYGGALFQSNDHTISSSTILAAMPLRSIDFRDFNIKSACFVGDGKSAGSCACRYPSDFYVGEKKEHPSYCMIKPSFYTKLENLAKKVDPKYWQITEAFPPTVQHSSSCHNSLGTCVDVVLIPKGGVISCQDIQFFINEATSVGLKVLNEYDYCNGIKTEYGTGNHLHIYE